MLAFKDSRQQVYFQGEAMTRDNDGNFGYASAFLTTFHAMRMYLLSVYTTRDYNNETLSCFIKSYIT